MSAEIAAVEITESAGGVTFAVKVVPGASRSRLAGVLGSAVKVTIAAPPEAGKANAAVVELLAAGLGVPRRSISLVSGATKPLKRMQIAGISADELRRRLGAALG